MDFDNRAYFFLFLNTNKERSQRCNFLDFEKNTSEDTHHKVEGTENIIH